MAEAYMVGAFLGFAGGFFLGFMFACMFVYRHQHGGRQERLPPKNRRS